MSGTLVGVGDRYDRLTSSAAFSTSLDGFTWTTPIDPFGVRVKAVGVAKGPTNTVIIGDGGWVTYSDNAVDWITGKFWFGNFAPMSIYYSANFSGNNGLFMCAGQGKFLKDEDPFLALDEVAMIFKNSTGENWAWELFYYYNEPNSRFYGVKRIIDAPYDVWIAVGSCNSYPIAVYSLDNGLTWNDITFPNVPGVKYAYDVIYNPSTDKFWFTVNGYIWSTPSIIEPEWTSSPQIVTKYGSSDFRQIAVNPAGEMVTVSSGGLAYTNDYIGWNLISIPGYRFRSVIWHNNKWVAGAESELTQYTYWTSTDSITWSPENNSIQMFDFTII